MTKGKHEARTGAGANSGSANFVFASVSPGRPDGGKEDAGGDDSRREENSKKSTANKGFKRKKMVSVRNVRKKYFVVHVYYVPLYRTLNSFVGP